MTLDELAVAYDAARDAYAALDAAERVGYADDAYAHDARDAAYDAARDALAAYAAALDAALDAAAEAAKGQA